MLDWLSWCQLLKHSTPARLCYWSTRRETQGLIQVPACLTDSVRKVAHRLFQDGQTAEEVLRERKLLVRGWCHFPNSDQESEPLSGLVVYSVLDM